MSKEKSGQNPAKSGHNGKGCKYRPVNKKVYDQNYKQIFAKSRKVRKTP